VKGQLVLASLIFGCFATASAAEICSGEQLVAAKVDPRHQVFIDWDADPDALAYCHFSYSYLKWCTEPSLESDCIEIFHGRVHDLSVRVDAFTVTNGLLFGRVLATSSCDEGEPSERYLPIKAMDCTFRP
jgi:hypothetical protein